MDKIYKSRYPIMLMCVALLLLAGCFIYLFFCQNMIDSVFFYAVLFFVFGMLVTSFCWYAWLQNKQTEYEHNKFMNQCREIETILKNNIIKQTAWMMYLDKLTDDEEDDDNEEK